MTSATGYLHFVGPLVGVLKPHETRYNIGLDELPGELRSLSEDLGVYFRIAVHDTVTGETPLEVE